MNRWRFEAGILSVAAGCQAVTGGGEPLPEHVARCDPSFTQTAGPEWKGMSLATRELPRILHSVASLQGYRVFAGRSVATWMVVRLGTGVAARALEPFRWSQRWQICLFLPRSTASRGGGEAVWDFSWTASFSWPLRASFGSEEPGLLRRRSWALSPPRREGSRMKSASSRFGWPRRLAASVGPPYTRGAAFRGYASVAGFKRVPFQAWKQAPRVTAFSASLAGGLEGEFGPR